jgi:hypothetical protein
VRLLRVVLAALDAVTVAGALEGIAPGSARGLVLVAVAVAVVGLALVAVAAVLAAGILAQRQPPFPM